MSCRVDLMSGLKRIKMIDHFWGKFLWANSLRKIQRDIKAEQRSPSYHSYMQGKEGICAISLLEPPASRSLTHSLAFRLWGRAPRD